MGITLPTKDITISTEKLRVKLIEHGLSKEVVIQRDNIMLIEFSNVKDRVTSYAESMCSIIGTNAIVGGIVCFHMLLMWLSSSSSLACGNHKSYMNMVGWMGMISGVGKPYVNFLCFISWPILPSFIIVQVNKVGLEINISNEMQSQVGYGGIHRLKKYYGKI